MELESVFAPEFVWNWITTQSVVNSVDAINSVYVDGYVFATECDVTMVPHVFDGRPE
jgi:hypothetical protein